MTEAGHHFNIKTIFPGLGIPKDKSVIRLSYIFKDNSYIDKAVSLYWNRPQDLFCCQHIGDWWTHREIARLYEICKFQCMDKIFCVELQFKFHTRYIAYTLKGESSYKVGILKAVLLSGIFDMVILIDLGNCVSGAVAKINTKYLSFGLQLIF